MTFNQIGIRCSFTTTFKLPSSDNLCKIQPKNLLPPPPPQEREIRHYKKANIDLVQQAIREFTWQRAFHRKNINAKVAILNNTINNVLSNFIPHETITCDDKKPPWLNKNIINLIKNKNIYYKSYTANENSTDKKEAIKALQNKLTSAIENAKSEYYSKLSMKLSNPETSSKTYWSILKSFAHDKKSLSFPYYTTMVILLPIFAKKRNFLTPFVQSNVLYYRTVVNFQPT